MLGSESFFTSLDLFYIGALHHLKVPDTGKELPLYAKAAIIMINNGQRFSNAFHAGSTLEKIMTTDPTNPPISRSFDSAHNCNCSRTADPTALGIVHHELIKCLYLKIEANLPYTHFSHSDLIAYFKQLMRAGKYECLSHLFHLFKCLDTPCNI